MKASYQWLKELTGIDATPEELAEKMTDLGLEVEGLERFEAAPLVVVAEVRAKEKHPKRDKLTVVQVDDGSGEDVTVVCGAPNVPEVGGKVLFAQVGAKLPTEDGGVFEIGERKLGGVLSRGMICSERELNLGAGHEGIFVFGPDAPANGTPLAEALPVGDVVFEIGLTPNRPDCLGHLGLARDLCAAWGKPFTPPPVPTPRHAEGVVAVVPKGETTFRLPWSGDGPEVAWDGPSDALGPFAVDIEHAEGCPRYGAAFVLAVKVGPSPFWLRYRLHCLGHRSISNLVDATNLVMLETGHPIHGFDLETLRGRRIVVRGAEAGETMTTLDDEERELAPGDLLICDGEGPVALAGVMGGANSEIGDGTQHVAIECAYFDPRAVRRTSRRLGMHTDASHRFERGVDPNDVPRVLARAAALMAELGGGVALAEGLDAYPAPVQVQEVTLRRHVLDGLLGLEVPKEVPAKVLGDLGFEVLEDGEDAVKVAVPTWRPDVAREADLVEEVGRVYGYERVPTVVPPVQPSRSGTSARIQLERRLRETAASTGLMEAVSYAFVAPRDLEKVRAVGEPVALQNPLSEERSVMRTSLLPGLAAAGSHSLRRQVEAVALFELGRVFGAAKEGLDGWGRHLHGMQSDSVLPLEHPMLGIFVAGTRRDWLGGERAADFYDLKGHVEALVAGALGATATLVVDDDLDAPFLHPKRRARVDVGGRAVGVLGELHPDVGDALELDEVRGHYAELDVVALLQACEELGVPQASEPPRVPAVVRDIALLVDDALPAGELASVLQEASGGMAEAVTLFDLYRGEKLPEGKKSLAFRIRYRDPETTLTDKKVDKIHGKVAKAAKQRCGAEVR